MHKIILFLSFLFLNSSTANDPPAMVHRLAKHTTYLENLTGDDLDSAKNRWDQFYEKKKGYAFGKKPAAVLMKHIKEIKKIKPDGKVLDIAMGEGRNAVYMASQGYDVEGVDISRIAIKRAKQLADEKKVKIKTIIADLSKYEVPEDSYDIIMVVNYLQRSLTPQIIKGLKKGGLVIFENYTMEHLKYDKTYNRDYLLEKGELKTMFPDFKIVYYGEVDKELQGSALIIAIKE